jgi:hypothetical protein
MARGWLWDSQGPGPSNQEDIVIIIDWLQGHPMLQSSPDRDVLWKKSICDKNGQNPKKTVIISLINTDNKF